MADISVAVSFFYVRQGQFMMFYSDTGQSVGFCNVMNCFLPVLNLQH